MLLLLLGFCLRRRWLRTKARGKIEKDVNDSEMEASEQGARADSGEAGAEPLPELVTEQDRIEGLRIFQPSRLPRGGISNRMLWRFGARETVAAASEAMDGFGRQWAFTAPVAATDAAIEAIITVPDTRCVARASGSGGNGQANLSADAQRCASRKASIDVEPPSTHPKPSPARKVMSQGKLAEAVEAAPTEKAARFRARKASITAGDELFEGAKGTKEGPGREVSTRRGRTSGSLATSEGAHMAANIRSALSYDAGSSGSISISNSGRQTEPSARDQRVPNPPARRPDDIWAAVRARRASTAALNTDRRQRLQAMHRELARPSFRERSLVGKADPVRV